MIERRYRKRHWRLIVLDNSFPVVYWLLCLLTTLVSLAPESDAQRKRGRWARWVSPDREQGVIES